MWIKQLFEMGSLFALFWWITHYSHVLIAVGFFVSYFLVSILVGILSEMMERPINTPRDFDGET
jgi:uncharacterized membrane protein YjjB (DUF3815 family)